MRVFLRVAGAAVLVYVVAAGGLYWAMRQTPDRFGHIMKRVPMPAMMVLPFERLWSSARQGTLQAGDVAPEFRLPLQDRSGEVSLAVHRGVRPVVLVFGSYT